MAQRQFRSDDTATWGYRFGGGSNGALVISSNTTEAPIDSACTGTINTTSLSATNVSFAAGQLILIHQTRGTGAGQWELNRIESYTAGTITTTHNLIYGYASGAQVRVLPQYSSVTVNSGILYTAKAWNGSVGGILAFLCNGQVTITGTIDANGNNGATANAPSTAVETTGGGFRGGAGSATEGVERTGEGYVTSLSTDSPTTTDNAGGGGGAGAGGGGGNGTAGGAGAGGSGNGAGGAIAGNAALTSMFFGGGAGGGQDSNPSLNPDNGAGGSGGAIVLIIGRKVTVTGAINSNGGAGGNANASGGGGAGGSILIKTQEGILGAGLVTATGGLGGTVGYADGGNGGVGRIHADYLISLTGTTTPTLDSTQDNTLTDIGGGFLSFL